MYQSLIKHVSNGTSPPPNNGGTTDKGSWGNSSLAAVRRCIDQTINVLLNPSYNAETGSGSYQLGTTNDREEAQKKFCAEQPPQRDALLHNSKYARVRIPPDPSASRVTKYFDTNDVMRTWFQKKESPDYKECTERLTLIVDSDSTPDDVTAYHVARDVACSRREDITETASDQGIVEETSQSTDLTTDYDAAEMPTPGSPVLSDPTVQIPLFVLALFAGGVAGVIVGDGLSNMRNPGCTQKIVQASKIVGGTLAAGALAAGSVALVGATVGPAVVLSTFGCAAYVRGALAVYPRRRFHRVPESGNTNQPTMV